MAKFTITSEEGNFSVQHRAVCFEHSSFRPEARANAILAHEDGSRHRREVDGPHDIHIVTEQTFSSPLRDDHE